VTQEFEERKFLLAEIIRVYKELIANGKGSPILEKLLKESEEEYKNLFH